MGLKENPAGMAGLSLLLTLCLFLNFLITPFLNYRFQRFTYPFFNFIRNFRIVVQELFHGIASLPYFSVVVAEPRTAFVEYTKFHAHVYNFANLADTFPENNIKLHLPERRCNFVFYNFHTGAVTACYIAVL